MPRFFMKTDDSDTESEFGDDELSTSVNTFKFTDDELDLDETTENYSNSTNSSNEDELFKREVEDCADRWQHDPERKASDGQAILDNLSEVLASPEKKKIKKLLELEKSVKINDLGVGLIVKIKYSIITAVLDFAMERRYWDDLLDCTSELLNILNSNANVILNARISKERLSKNQVESEEDPKLRFYLICGSMLPIVEEMDDTFNHMLKECYVNSMEFAEQFEYEDRICEIIDSLQLYLERLNLPSELCRIYMRKIEHLYGQFDLNCISDQNQADARETSLQVMDRLCKFIYERDQCGKLRSRALLSQIYHLALHNEWNRAVGMLNTTQWKDLEVSEDIRMLYHAALVQLGLCAFRRGCFPEAHYLLSHILSRDWAASLARDELKRRTLFYLHEDKDVLECVCLVSAMLIETPYLPANRSLACANLITDPPDTFEEYVAAASRAMRNGLWFDCVFYIINKEMNKVWNRFYEADKIRTMLIRKIREQSLRAYLAVNIKKYNSISMSTLSGMFQLEQSVVQSIIEKMIDKQELEASIDRLTQSVVTHRPKSPQLRYLSLALAGMKFP